MSHPTVIEINDVSKRFVIRKEKSLKERVVNFGRSQEHKEDFWALRNVSLTIESGTTVGLIGANGSGKSTLLKTIGGILQPNSGSVNLRGRLAALLELGAGFHPDLTGRENVYLNASILGLTREQTDGYFDEIVEFSGIEPFIDTQVKFYSSGMYVRLAFAVAIHVDPDILLVDEVLAVGDEAFQRKCLDKIRQFQSEGRTIIIVTHSLDTVAEMCSRAIVLDHGRIIADDAPEGALRVLRREFEEVRQGELQRAQIREEEAHATTPHGLSEVVLPEATIDKIQVLQRNEPIDNPIFNPGDRIEFDVEVSSKTALEGWNLRVTAVSPLGQTVYSTSTSRLGVQPPTITHGARFRFAFPNAAFGSGAYLLSASLLLDGGPEIHHLKETAGFTIADDGVGVGILHIATEFAVVTLT